MGSGEIRRGFFAVNGNVRRRARGNGIRGGGDILILPVFLARLGCLGLDRGFLPKLAFGIDSYGKKWLIDIN